MNALTLAFFAGPPGGGEVLVILVVMLLLFGAKKLPGMARTLGKTLEEFRRATREVTDEIMHADRHLDDPATRPPERLAGSGFEDQSPPPGTQDQSGEPDAGASGDDNDDKPELT
jgi:sec-independent protein translocase protein TatA